MPELVGGDQQQPRAVLAGHLLQPPVLVIIKVSVSPVAREEGVRPLSSSSVKARTVPVISSLKSDVDVDLPRLLFSEFQIGHFRPDAESFLYDLINSFLRKFL